MKENNQWLYNDKTFEEDIDSFESFVYLIEELDTQKKYIGKKSFWKRRKTKKSKRRITSESDWQTYYRL